MNQMCANFSQQHSVMQALRALQNHNGVIVMDRHDRENEADIIFHAASLTTEQMALLIRECSGIVCLCLPEEKVNELGLPMMVTHNESRFQTGFTVTIESKDNVTTGVSAKDRLTMADGCAGRATHHLQSVGFERLGLKPHHVVGLQRLGQLDGAAELVVEGHIQGDAHIRAQRLAEGAHHGLGVADS